MKAKRIFFFATLAVAFGSMFVFAGCGKEKVDVENCEHQYEWTVDKDATCTEEGHRSGVCSICGNKTEEVIPLAAHKLEGEISVTTDATCMAEGSGTQMCSVCHTAQPVKIPKKDHNLEHVDGIPATCKDDGQLEYWHCADCGNNFLDDKGQNLAGSVVIPKESVEHTWNEKHVCSVCGASDPNSPHTCVPSLVAGIPSTCKDHGTKEHYKCYECGKLYLDEEGTKEVTEADLVLELSNDHGGKQNAVHYYAVEAKDCMTYGKKERYDCKVCGRHFKTEDLDPTKEYKDIEDVGEFTDDVLQTPKSNRHAKWQSHPQEDPTCAKIGWSEAVVECLICGNIYKSDDINQGGDNDGIVKEKEDEEHNPIQGTVREPVERSSVELAIDPDKHEGFEKHEKKSPNGCGSDDESIGYKLECYECTGCHKFYQDEQHTQLLTKSEVLDFAKHGTMKYVEATESTCTEHGHPAHWDCESCNEHFNTGDPAADTDPISDADYDLPLVAHDFSEYGKNSKGHWLVCKVCGTADVDEDGNLKIEEHDMEDGESENCYVCGFGGVDYAGFFEFTTKKDKEGNEYAILKGLYKNPNETDYEIMKQINEGETVLRIPETDHEGNPVTQIQANALSPNYFPEYGNVLSKITEVVIPNTVTKVGSNAFYGYYERMPGFQRIEFESGVNEVEIGKGAFQNLTNLKTLILPQRMTTIPANMVYNCSALTEIRMPEQITKTSEGITLENVFYNCSSLEVIDLWCLDNISFSFGYMCLFGCSSLKNIYIPKSVTKLGGMSFNGCTAIEHIYYGGTQEEWNNLCNSSKTGETYPWNHNNAHLSDETLGTSGIVVYNHTHTGSEY